MIGQGNLEKEYMNFIDSFQKIIENKGTNANAVAKATGVSVNTIYAWAKGSYPTLDKMIPVADFLDVSLDELAGRTTPALSKREAELLRLYAGLSDEDKDTVDGLALFLFSKR